MSATDSAAQDKNSVFVNDTVRSNANNIAKDQQYYFFNRPAWQVSTAAVAPPVVARAGTASKVKTTATTQLYVNGIPLSLTATDNLWTLTGANLAAGSVRAYQLLWDGTSATTVVSVAQSNDLLIANYANAAAAIAALRWPANPAGGTVIVGILNIANVTNAFIPGTTLLSATGVTDTYVDGPDTRCPIAYVVTP